MPKEKASLPLWGLPPFQGETAMIPCTEGNGCEPKEKAPAPKGRGWECEKKIYFFLRQRKSRSLPFRIRRGEGLTASPL